MLRIHGGLSEVPKPGCSGTNTSKLLGQQVEHRQPHRQAVGAMQEQERRAGAAAQHPHVDVADLVFRFRPRHGIVLRQWWAAIYRPAQALQSRDDRPMAAADTERFRLRRFVERLVQLGECEVHDKPIDLVDVGAVLDGNPRATWFKAVGPEKAELIGNVMGSRKRLALALDTDEAGLLPEITKRLAEPAQAGQGVGRGRAGAAGGAARARRPISARCRCICSTARTARPISPRASTSCSSATAAITNIGCRRIMLRGPRTAGIDMIAPSDARAIYLEGGGEGREDAGRLCGRLARRAISWRRSA